MPSINRGLIWSVLPKLPLEFLNVNKAVTWLQKEGKGYHYQTMWHDVRTAFDTFQKAPLQRTFAADEYIPQNLFIEKDWKRPENYYYYGNLWLRDLTTDELHFRAYSLYADSSLTDNEVAEIVYWIEEEEEEEYGPGWEVVSFESLQRYHKWGAPRSEGYRIAEI